MSDSTAVGFEDEREFLLRSIEDLDAEFAAGDIDEHDYRDLRDRYTTRAAEVLRAIEHSDGAVVAEDAPRRRRSSTRLVAAAVIVVLVAVAAGVGVAAFSGERDPGQSITSGVPTNPIDAKIAKAQTLVSKGKVLDAVKLYDEVLKDDPENPVALAQRGWLVSRVDDSLVDIGLSNIDEALKIDPGYAEAHFFRGMILWQAKHQPAAAADEFDKALSENPPSDLATFLRGERDRARAEASGAPAPPSGPSTTAVP